jgi:transposase-like protein
MYENGANVNQICRKLDLTKHTVQSLIDKWFPEDKEPEPAPKAETTKEVTKPRAAKVKAADEFS